MECIQCNCWINEKVSPHGSLIHHQHRWYKINTDRTWVHFICFTCLESFNVSPLYCYCETCGQSYVTEPTNDIIKKYHARDDIPTDFTIKSIGVYGYDAVVTEAGIETDYRSRFSHVSFVNG